MGVLFLCQSNDFPTILEADPWFGTHFSLSSSWTNLSAKVDLYGQLIVYMLVEFENSGIWM